MKQSSILKTWILLFAVAISPLWAQNDIQWVDISKANAQKKITPNKSIMVFFHTSWCGYCKRMDAQYFKDPTLVKYINDNFIPVRFDAENKNTVVFNGRSYVYMAAGGRGFNLLAYNMLNGRMSYPSTVILNSNMNPQYLYPGMPSTMDDFMKFLKQKVK